jgi:multiple sugar transport system permease protein
VRLAPWAIVIVDTWMWTPFVMLICLAGLRSIPDYIYEAAESTAPANGGSSGRSPSRWCCPS